MLFPTFEFFAFFVACFVIAWSLNDNNLLRKVFLIGASWLFYAFWDFRFVLLLIVSGLANWFFADLIQKHDESPKLQKRFLVFGVVFNLSILGFFKYFNFFYEQILEILSIFGFARDSKILSIILPVAISFFTFQGISYLVDVYRKKCEPLKNPLDLVLLTSFFPHLIAGPIVRPSDILPQFKTAPRPNSEFFAWGALLIIWGLFKKTIIASTLADHYVDKIFFAISEQSSLNLWVGLYAYAVQIYCDFSAYSDIAIGAAALLGYRFTRNFDQPYRASSLRNFWRRWHISLSTWLRDYLFIPLGGSKGSNAKTNRNLLITMGLGGLWHGANWTFIVWGLIHGFGLVIEKWFRDNRKPHSSHLPHRFKIFLTFHLVCFAWIFFRAENFSDAISYLKGLFGQSGIISVNWQIIALVLVGFAINFIDPQFIEKFAKACSKLRPLVMASICAFLFILIDALRDPGIAPFIYFQF